MNGEEILKLIDAGFSADEIRKMQTSEPSSDEQKDAPEANKVQEVKVDPEADKGKDINTDFMDSITKAVSDLTDKVKAIQESNVKGAREPERKDLTTDEVIKSFIESM